ncbi:MAG: hypothetical protein LLF98_02530 [Clostridium sp.]|uniref:hypothetical protein n=1 Tax=Clostridium sp. TaxID=1506 RepID=UPI0025C26721|nr:hypothetical protein [Clostridium sp.]MCE5220159.1 hypothetical protein [Clostridium sp.]
MFKVTEKINIKENVWEYIFNLIQEFKTEYGFIIKSLGHLEKDIYYFSMDKYTIYFEVNSKGFWLTLEADVNLKDFNMKYNFIFGKDEN